MRNKTSILIVDDEESICEILRFNLVAEGFKVDVSYSAEKALKLDLRKYSLILLDVMMENMNGFQMARLLKKDKINSSIPIIFCTAKDSVDKKVEGLEIGADDFITKPFAVKEVMARIKAVLRRYSNIESSTSELLTFRGLTVDPLSKECKIDGEVVNLTKTEFEILFLLMSNRSVVYSREEILEKAWVSGVVVLKRSVDVNITRLRKKMGKYGKSILTRQGYGYEFE